MNIFRFFENLVDPYVAYKETDTPPRTLRAFMWDYSQPFRKLFVVAGIFSVLTAAVEVGLIYYMGRIVDVLSSGTPEVVWQTYGTEIIWVALFVLFARPVFQALDVLVLNNALLPNYGTLFRWRAHRQVLRQSVGWFENDFAGRIAGRIMQTPPAAGEAMFQVFDAMSFAVAYVIGAAFLLSAADPRLAVPLLIWALLYAALTYWTVKRVGPASQAASDARSAVTGRVVDSYSNIHSVKMFAHHDQEIDYAKDAIERSRQTFSHEMRIFSVMDVALNVLNGLLIVGVVGWAILLWMQGSASVGIVTAAAGITLRLNGMSGWVMWAVSSFFRQLGVVAEGMQTIAQPITLTDVPQAPALNLSKGEIVFENLTHHYGRG
jgi:ATP-binding cassette subfamily B multidrug efflux pump